MDDPANELEALKARIGELEADAGRHLVTRRDLSRAKDQVDVELARFRVIQDYIGRALEIDGEDAFLALTLETLIEAFEYQAAAFLEPDETGASLLVSHVFGFERPPDRLAMDPAWFEGDDANVHEAGSPLLGAWVALDLHQAICCPIIGGDGQLNAVVAAGVTRECVDFFNPITIRDASAFNVLVRQAGGLWANRKLTADIREKNKRLEVETANQLVLQRDLVRAKGLVDGELARFMVLQSYIERALDVEGDEAFFVLTLEALIEAFEHEVALFLLVSPAADALDVVGEFGFAETPPALALPADAFAARGALLVDDKSRLLRAWAGLGLGQAIVCPFYDKNNALSGALLGGITAASADYFDPIAEEQASAFSVMVRQAGAIWINRQLNEEIRQHNARLTSLTNSYSRFVPFQFLELLERQSIEEIYPGDSTLVETSVLFADIRGFTTLSQNLGAEGTFTTLNEFLTAMEPFIAEHGGFINQYLGDAIMALFPGPADDALGCARALLDRAVSFNRDRLDNGRPAIRFGMGISSGPLMLGAIGGGERLDSNVIGDTANLASRTEGLTKIYGAECMFTALTEERLPKRNSFRYRELDRVVVKGRTSAVAVYELLDDGDVKIATMDDFARGLALYRDRAFAAARQCFKMCEGVETGDPAAALFSRRCDAFQTRPPPDDWTGDWVLERK